jgi:diacylglycerol kinase (ATP)
MVHGAAHDATGPVAEPDSTAAAAAPDPSADRRLPTAHNGRAALVYNPTKADAKTLRAAVRHASARAGWARPRFYETTIADLGADATRHALRDGADAVLVAGGDGTVRAVASALVGTGIPLTILPSGTGNLLARNLQLPHTDVTVMIEATFVGERHAIDVGRAAITRADGTTEDEVFVVLAGIGLDAAMIANTRADLKKTVGWVAYVDGAARALPGAKPFRVLYDVDASHGESVHTTSVHTEPVHSGPVHSGPIRTGPIHTGPVRTHTGPIRTGPVRTGRLHSAKVQSVLFANCGTLPAGIALIPGASIADGQLDIALIQPSGWLGWLGVWRKVWWDNSVLRRSRAGRRIVARRKDSSVHYLRGVRAHVATDQPYPIELDGDEFGDALRLTCSVDAGGLLVAVPAGHDTSRI